ncbi:MAG: S1/P1 nuclease [Ferruginibacter sp.]
MKKRSATKILILGLFFYMPFQSMAWGLLGHRIVGEIAESYLNTKARAAIKKILGDESMAMAANWADFIRSDTSLKYLDPWHYVDFDSGLNYNEMKEYLRTDTAVDAYTKLAFLTNELKKKNLSEDKKLFYLKMLIHIAGDIHQPLHASAHGDQGGNAIKVQWFNQPYNLHSVWDTYFIESQKLSYTEYAHAINHVTPQQKTIWQKQPVSKWIFDSYSISNTLRSEIKPDQKLSYDYNFRYLKTLNEQLLKGGVHLAGLLNEIFG